MMHKGMEAQCRAAGGRYRLAADMPRSKSLQRRRHIDESARQRRQERGGDNKDDDFETG